MQLRSGQELGPHQKGGVTRYIWILGYESQYENCVFKIRWKASYLLGGERLHEIGMATLCYERTTSQALCDIKNEAITKEEKRARVEDAEHQTEQSLTTESTEATSQHRDNELKAQSKLSVPHASRVKQSGSAVLARNEPSKETASPKTNAKEEAEFLSRRQRLPARNQYGPTIQKSEDPNITGQWSINKSVLPKVFAKDEVELSPRRYSLSLRRRSRSRVLGWRRRGSDCNEGREKVKSKTFLQPNKSLSSTQQITIY